MVGTNPTVCFKSNALLLHWRYEDTVVNMGIEESGNVDEDIAFLRTSARSGYQAVGGSFKCPS